jgi:filamentous hemagglutinin family protein
MKTQLSFLLLIISLPTPAQITTDGTLGPALNLQGPDYQIGPDLGQQHGGNLFHSFQDFNLNRVESATFSGPNSVSNVISRVTGGNPSNLDGTIRSTIPNADMYFLNPYGIMFGPNTKLDVQGSFHASTADYLRLGDGGRFDARNPSESLLTVAPIERFGFITNSPAKITTQSSKLILASDQTLSLIGGDIHLNSDTPLTADHSSSIPIVESESILAAEHGQVNLVSMASTGEMQLTENDVIVQGIGGNIKLDNTFIEMSGYSGGAIFVRAAHFTMDNSIVQSNTFGDLDGKGMNFKLTETAHLNGLNTEISVITASQSNNSGIVMEVPYLEMTGALINTGSILTGRTGDIEIDAKNIVMKDSAFIASGSIYAGRSGDIKLEVEDSLSLIGYYPGYRISHRIEFYNSPSQIISVSIGAGDSGNIFINTKNLNMSSSIIATDTFGIGQGGNLTINAVQARLINGALISSTTFDKGQAGNVKLNITGQLDMAGQLPFVYQSLGDARTYFNGSIRSSSLGQGNGGMLDIQANNIFLTDGAQILAHSIATGNAGDIFIQANNIQVMDGGNINTSAEHALGGNISLIVPDLLYLQEGVITTSVHGGIGDGGNISISHPQFTILNKGQIKAQADEGHGGNIRIKADQFIKSPESLISASSRLGLDGELKIDSPTVDLDAMLVVLPGGYVEQAQLKTCTTEDIDNPSTFKIGLSRERKVPFQE